MRLKILDGIHGRFENMGLDGDGDLANLVHHILRRVIWFFSNHTLPLCRLRPVLFEYALLNPFLTRSQEGFGKNTADQGVSTKKQSL